MHRPGLIVEYVPAMLPYYEQKGATDLQVIIGDVTSNRQMLIQYSLISIKHRTIKPIPIEKLCNAKKANEI